MMVAPVFHVLVLMVSSACLLGVVVPVLMAEGCPRSVTRYR